uniref:Uncharacterized protein n=1 Tax=Aegilops tauschii subsp. strangulata TaxID=200361 RepID=A0A453SNM7_AEGTS
SKVPSGEALTFGDENFVSLEAAGVKEARNAAFVLVAGGLGERLGYKGIKVMWLEFLIVYLQPRLGKSVMLMYHS